MRPWNPVAGYEDSPLIIYRRKQDLVIMTLEGDTDKTLLYKMDTTETDDSHLAFAVCFFC